MLNAHFDYVLGRKNPVPGSSVKAAAKEKS